MRIAFGDCVFDSDTREVARGGETVHVSPKAFRLLELLLKSRPRALSKSELKDAIWPQTFVLETNLANLAAELRAALGEGGRRSGCIRTVHGFGYAFSGETVLESPKEGRGGVSGVALIGDDRTFALANGENVLGRDPAAEVYVEDTAISRRHARITVHGPEATLEDLGSKNGTFLGGKRVTAPVRLRDTDAILLGSVLLTVRLAEPGRSTKTLKSGGPRPAR